MTNEKATSHHLSPGSWGGGGEGGVRGGEGVGE